MEVNIHEAKTHLSRLLERVAMGEEVIIAKAGTPVAKLVPVHARPKKRMLGSAKGKFTVPEDFNDPLPKESGELFYEGGRSAIHIHSCGQSRRQVSCRAGLNRSIPV